MKYKIGDRIQDPWDDSIFEVTGFRNVQYICVCIDPGETTIARGVSIDLYLSGNHKYLGNFAKQSNFETLYNLFNQ